MIKLSAIQGRILDVAAAEAPATALLKMIDAAMDATDRDDPGDAQRCVEVIRGLLAAAPKA